MIQTIFEEMGGTYSQHGEYLLPNLLLLQEEESTEGSIWVISGSISRYTTPIC